MQFIIAQSFGVLAVIMTLASTQSKSKNGSMIFIALMDSFIIAQYALLGATTGVFVNAVGLLRVLAFYWFDKNEKKIPLWVFLSASAAICLTGAITYQKPIDILPTLGTLIFTYGLWQNSIKVLRVTQLITALATLGYNIDVSAYADCARAGLEAVFSVVGYVRYPAIGRHR